MIIVLHLYVHVLSRCHNDGWFLFFLRSLSHSLNSLRRHRESLSSDSTPPTAPRAQNGENPVVSAANKPTTSSSALQGRVKVLEDHNSKLENVISELKRVTEPVCVQLLGEGGREGGRGGGKEGGGREGGREGDILTKINEVFFATLFLLHSSSH